MTCMHLPELPASDLMAAIDGEADPATLSHLGDCPYCAARLAELRLVQHRFRRALFRGRCPPPESLGNYHFGILKPARCRAIAAHLASCPHCTRELSDLEASLAELAAALQPGLVEHVRVLVARLISTGLSGTAASGSSLQPAYAGLRGYEEAGLSVYQAGTYLVNLLIEDDLAQPGRRVLMGLVSGAEAAGMDVHLTAAGQPAGRTTIDTAGNFVLEGLLPGAYRLVLSQPTLQIEVESVVV